MYDLHNLFQCKMRLKESRLARDKVPMIDAARRAAEESLLDQALVRVDQKTYDYFVEVLDRPPDGDGFERLMTANKTWDA